MRVFSRFLLALLLIASMSVVGSTDEPNEWLTWTLKDAAGNTINLDDHKNHNVYVIVFAPDCKDSCKLMRKAAQYIREHPNRANRVLALCTDDAGAKALKLFMRQEEYAKRVKAWNEAQEAAKQAAEQANEPYEAPAMPDYAKEVEDELADPGDLAALMAYHFPFKTACRCDPMWTWLTERIEAPQSAPRVVKFDSQGVKLGEWPDEGDPNRLASD